MVALGSRRFVLVSCEICEPPISVQVLDVDSLPFIKKHEEYHRQRGDM